MKTDDELEKTFEVFVDATGLLNMVFLGAEYDDADNTRQAELARDKSLEIFKSDPKKVFDVIADTTPMLKKAYISKEARDVYINLAGNKQVGRVAIVGETDFQTVVLEFALSLMRAFDKKITWFKHKEEALLWLGRI